MSKKTSKPLFVIFLLSLLILAPSSMKTINHSKATQNYNQIPGKNKILSQHIQTDALTAETSIYISGNTEFANVAASKSWSGSGTEMDPYIIDNINITDTPDFYGLKIESTSVYFIINNTYFNKLIWGIELTNVNHAVIANSTFMEIGTAIQTYSSSNITISDNTFDDVLTGISTESLQSSSIDNNSFTNIDTKGIEMELGDHNNVTANYMSDAADSMILRSVSYYKIENNVIINSQDSDLNIITSKFVKILDNTFENYGVSIDGSNIQDYTHFEFSNNFVNGKKIYYIVNSTSLGLINNPGQIITANCSDLIIDGLSTLTSKIPVIVSYTNDSVISNSEFIDQKISLSNAVNVTVDQNTFQLTINQSLRAIDVSDSQSVKIKNNMITGFYNAIELNFVDGSVIRNNQISNTQNSAISLFSSELNTIVYNNISQTSNGIKISGSTQGNSIENNTILSSVYGIELLLTKGTTIKSNVLIGGTLKFDEIDPAYEPYLQDEVVNNTIDGNPIKYLSNANNITLTGNYGQIFLVKCTNVNLTDIVVQSIDTGIIIAQSSDIKLSRITAMNHSNIGIEFYDSENSYIQNSTISNSYTGISLRHTQTTNVFNSTIENNSIGIYIESSSSANNIIQTNFDHNTNAILLEGGKNNIHRSLFTNSKNYAIEVHLSSMNAKILDNDFISNNVGNGSQISDEGTSTIVSNNYWSDWANLQQDQNNDGYLDSPYFIDGSVNNIDANPRAYSSSANLIPGTPRNINFSIVNTTVRLDWQPPQGDNVAIKFYRVYKAEQGREGFELIGISNTTVFEDIKVSTGTYYYFITAVNNYGESDFSKAVRITITIQNNNNTESSNDNNLSGDNSTNFFKDNQILLGGIVGMAVLSAIIALIIRRKSV